MIARNRPRFASLLVLVGTALAACGTPPTPDDGGRRDAQRDGSPDGATICTTDPDCSDRVFCNGIELCMPGAPGADSFGCVVPSAATPCRAGQRCVEANSRCETTCTTTQDADGDGHRATECGGDDCDDSDPTRFPGATEVCDSHDHDEDCDAHTFGARDADGDGHLDALCCNIDNASARICGDDCDDTQPTVHPGALEVCDSRDNNCDGVTDEGTQRMYYRDSDGDRFGDPMQSTAPVCMAPANYVEDSTDCDDADARRNPGAPEVCDGVDNNCNGMIDEGMLRTYYPDMDGDRFGDMNAAPMSFCPSNVPHGWVDDNADCDDTSASRNPAALEICDGIDTNCNGRLDGIDEDDDLDGHADNACAGVRGTDCDDTAATTYVGAPELCDGIDSDCSVHAPGTPGGMDASEDADGDHHAPASATCSGGPYPRDDCNDMQNASYPGATELCDRIDNDCSSGGGVETSEDADNDGYSSTTATCASNGMPQLPRTDCDDASAGVHPGAVDICDGVNNDCTGTTDTQCARSLSFSIGANTATPGDASGGVPMNPICTGGEVLTGLYGNVSTGYVRLINLFCSPWNLTTQSATVPWNYSLNLSGPSMVPTAFGDQAQAANFSLACPAGSMVSSMRVNYGATGVTGVAIRCRTTTFSGTRGAYSVTPDAEDATWYAAGAAAGSNTIVSCPAEVFGITGRAGAWADSVGLTCGTNPTISVY